MLRRRNERKAPPAVCLTAELSNVLNVNGVFATWCRRRDQSVTIISGSFPTPLTEVKSRLLSSRRNSVLPGGKKGTIAPPKRAVSKNRCTGILSFLQRNSTSHFVWSHAPLRISSLATLKKRKEEKRLRSVYECFRIDDVRRASSVARLSAPVRTAQIIPCCPTAIVIRECYA